MTAVLRYGFDSQVPLDLPADLLVAPCDVPRGEPISSVADAVRAALENPLEFPPLSDAIVQRMEGEPGDRVVLVVDEELPRAGELVGAVLRYLLDHDVAADDIAVLRTGSPKLPQLDANVVDPLLNDTRQAGLERLEKENWPAAPEFRRALGPHSAAGVEFLFHDPHDRNQLAYLANTQRGRPIYLNRALCDADVILCLGCLHGTPTLGYHGVHDSLYPAFSDAVTQRRYRSPLLADPHGRPHARATREATSVGWLAGTQFMVQVVPGPGDEVLHVLAGDTDVVRQQGQLLWQEAWERNVPQAAHLVIASLTGKHAQQSWLAFARALAAARGAVEEGGTIALCTETALPPGDALRALAEGTDPALVGQRIARDRPDDSVAALELIDAMAHAKVFLLSPWDETFVEDLGLAYVTEPADIARLARRHRSCLVLSDAQHAAAPSLEESSRSQAD